MTVSQTAKSLAILTNLRFFAALLIIIFHQTVASLGLALST
jgi:hypothetical protein